ncbi:MAG: TatD family hydrolase [Aestuariivita sp.]|nr:TatD family hydrolase [Aestuariivita sp.]
MKRTAHISDSHCHLDFPEFNGKIDQVVSKAARAGVTRMITICTNLHEEPQVRAIADKHQPVFYAAGVHPMNVAKEALAQVDELIKISRHSKMVGIGETGLDFFYTQESADLQIQSLRIHIAAARETNLPLIIHSRKADDKMSQILTEEYRNGDFSAVMHCFSSSFQLAKSALELGFYLSMSGIATFPRSHELRDIFAATPLERIIVETDAPYLAPPPHRGKRNEPAFVTHTAQAGAKLFGLDYETFAAQTEQNFDRLFTKARRQT